MATFQCTQGNSIYLLKHAQKTDTTKLVTSIQQGTSRQELVLGGLNDVIVSTNDQEFLRMSAGDVLVLPLHATKNGYKVLCPEIETNFSSWYPFTYMKFLKILSAKARLNASLPIPLSILFSIAENAPFPLAL